MGSDGALGMEVAGLHSAGTTMAGRSGTAQVHANGVKNSVDDAAGIAGHPLVRSALASLLDDHILDPAIKLPGLIAGGGEQVADLAGTGRNSDEEGARAIKTHVDAAETHATALTRRINNPG
ncbi:MAG TPA: hypothetical protein VN088_05110 [Nocardioides sp.]|nr:hypothetical protein [Nocardioides sp.]